MKLLLDKNLPQKIVSSLQANFLDRLLTNAIRLAEAETQDEKACVEIF